MTDESKTKEQLAAELAEMRRHVADVENVRAERDQAEERNKHLYAVLRAVRNVNQLITREKDRARLLQGACDLLTETRGYYNAWIALLDESNRLIQAAESGLTDRFQAMAERLRRGELTTCGRNARAQSGVLAIADPASACGDCPLAIGYGGRGAMTIRLEHEGKVYGLLSVSVPNRFASDEEEQSLFQEVAEDIAFALHDMELREQYGRARDATQLQITERKKAEEALTQRRTALESVYQIATSRATSLESICDEVVLGLSRILRVANVTLSRVDKDGVHITSKAADGPLSHHDKVVPAADCACTLVRETGTPYQYQGALRQRYQNCPCFAEHDFKSYVGVPVKDAEDNVLGVVCAMDCEERVFGEEDIRLIEIFAQYVAKEMRRDSIERELRESHRFKVLGQLTSGVAHEVRNPLSAIVAMTGAMEKALGDSPEYGPYLERIEQQVNRLSALMQDLLDLGKPLHPSRMERRALSAICAAVVDLWRESAADRTHTVRLIASSELSEVLVHADVAKFQQVLINLLDNAAYHSPEGSEILVTVLQPSRTMIRVQVTDRGSGMPPEVLAQVFDPFFTTRRKGTGLGLSLVKHIVDAHGGSVTIWNNDPPPGCTVEITLPVAQETK